MSGHGLAEEAESEGYFASVSDLMVGVLFVFLLMLTVFALNFRDDSARLDEAIARAERAEQEARLEKANAAIARTEAELQLAEAQRQAARALAREEEAARLRAQNEALRARLQEAADQLRRELADREAARNALLQRLAQGLEARRIQFILDPRSGVLRLSDAVPFPTGGSTLTDTARRTVTALGEVLAEVLPCFSRGGARQGCEGGDMPILEAMLVEGHTDRQPAMSESEAALSDLASVKKILELRPALPEQPACLQQAAVLFRKEAASELPSGEVLEILREALRSACAVGDASQIPPRLLRRAPLVFWDREPQAAAFPGLMKVFLDGAASRGCYVHLAKHRLMEADAVCAQAVSV